MRLHFPPLWLCFFWSFVGVFLLLLTTFDELDHLLQLKNPILTTYMDNALGIAGTVGCRRYSNTLTRCTSTAPTGTSLIGLSGDEGGQVMDGKKNTCGSHTNTQIAAGKPTRAHTLSGRGGGGSITSSSSGETKCFSLPFPPMSFFVQNL